MKQQQKKPEDLVNEFFGRVWTPPNDLKAIDELMTEDYEIVTAGKIIKGRENFKNWVREFHRVLLNPKNESLDTFSNVQGDKVVSRWVCSGTNNGIFGLPAIGQQISFTGIAIWELSDGRFSKCWVERSAFELYQQLSR